MCWDFFDDDFWDLDLEDFAIIGAAASLFEAERAEAEILRKELNEDHDGD